MIGNCRLRHHRLARAVTWAAGESPPVRVVAPKCVQATYCERATESGKRQLVIHLLNNVNTPADHGFLATDVPLREESLPIHDIRVAVGTSDYSRWTVQPAGHDPRVERDGATTAIRLPPLDVHSPLVGDA